MRCLRGAEWSEVLLCGSYICQAEPELLGYLQPGSRIGTLALMLGVHVQVLTSTVTSNGLPSAHSPGTRARFRRIAKREQTAVCCSAPIAFGGPACRTDVRQFPVEGPVTRAGRGGQLAGQLLCQVALSVLRACARVHRGSSYSKQVWDLSQCARFSWPHALLCMRPLMPIEAAIILHRRATQMRMR